MISIPTVTESFTGSTWAGCPTCAVLLSNHVLILIWIKLKTPYNRFWNSPYRHLWAHHRFFFITLSVPALFILLKSACSNMISNMPRSSTLSGQNIIFSFQERISPVSNHVNNTSFELHHFNIPISFLYSNNIFSRPDLTAPWFIFISAVLQQLLICLMLHFDTPITTCVKGRISYSLVQSKSPSTPVFDDCASTIPTSKPLMFSQASSTFHIYHHFLNSFTVLEFHRWPTLRFIFLISTTICPISSMLSARLSSHS